MTQTLDALAHGRYLVDPKLPQIAVVQDLVGDRRAVIGRHGVDTARDAHELCQNGIRRTHAFTDNVERARALAVKTEVLRA